MCRFVLKDVSKTLFVAVHDFDSIVTDPTPAKPKGKARKWSDEEIALLVLLLDIDFEDARQLWQQYAGSFAPLIDAEAFDNQDAVTGSPGFWFARERQQFAIGRKGYIAPETVQKATEIVRQKAQVDVMVYGKQMANGDIDLPLYQNNMQRLLKSLALSTAAIGRGGIQEIGNADETAVSAKLTTQLKALVNFAKQAEQGAQQANTTGVIMQRSRAYADDAMLMYPDRRAYSHKVVGFSEEQNVLGIADHCKRDPRRPWVETCPEQTAAGWVPIGSLAKIGERACTFNCKCHMNYRRKAEEQRGVA